MGDLDLVGGGIYAVSAGADAAQAGVSGQITQRGPNPYFSALSGLGAGFGAMSARTQARGQKNLLGYEAQVAGNQAAIAGYQAEVAQQMGAAREQDSRLQTAQSFGAECAHMAASGIDLGQGSATDVLASTE